MAETPATDARIIFEKILPTAIIPYCYFYSEPQVLEGRLETSHMAPLFTYRHPNNVFSEKKLFFHSFVHENETLGHFR